MLVDIVQFLHDLYCVFTQHNYVVDRLLTLLVMMRMIDSKLTDTATLTLELRPVAAMYVEPMVLIFSTLLNLGLTSNWEDRERQESIQE